MVGTYSQAFPLAPRDARDKAKERERAKSKTIDSPKVLPINILNAANATTVSRNQEHDADVRGSDMTLSDTFSAPPADADIQPGDLLNGVGSASSHASTVSEVFSNAATSSGPATSNNPHNTFTPLTLTESSPIEPQPSPRDPKADTAIHLLNDLSDNAAASHGKGLSPSHAMSHGTPSRNPPSTTRVQMRPPGVKGEKTTYDPELLLHLFQITRADAKIQKAKVQEFGGAVCTQYNNSLGERHLFELVCG